MKEYRDFIIDLPLYEAFINEKPKNDFETLD